MNRSSNAVLGGGLGRLGKLSLFLTAATTLLMLLVSCGDTVYESKGGGGSVTAGDVGTINVHVRDGAGLTPFTAASDEVYVTLIAAGQRPQLLSSSGGVSYPNLKPGSYEFRVEKEGYATSYYTADLLLEETSNPSYSVNLPAVIYKKDGILTGTLYYDKGDGTGGYAPSGTVVTVEIDLNRTIDYVQQSALRDVKIEERVITGTVGANGKYTIEGIPTVQAANYQVSVGGFEAGGVDFEAYDIFPFGEGRNLLSGISVTAVTKTNNLVVSELRVVSVPLSVEKSDKIEILFNAEPSDIGAASVVTIKGVVAFDVAYDGNKIVVTPKAEWKSLGSANLELSISGSLKSTKGAKFKDGGTIIVAVKDFRTNDFEIINTSNDGNIWLTDSAEAIVLKFSKEIDTAKLPETKFLANGVGHRTEISGNTLTISPVLSKWTSISGVLVLTNLTGLVSVDGLSFAGDVPLIKWGEPITIPFVLTSIDTILVGDESKKPVTLTLSQAFAYSAANNRVKILRNEDTTAADYWTKGIGDALDTRAEVPTVAKAGNSLIVTPGFAWGDAAGKVNIVHIDTLTSDDGIGTQKGGLVYKVTLLTSGKFEIVEREEPIAISKYTDSISFTFTQPIDTTKWERNPIALDPVQPFNIIYSDAGKKVTLKPVSVFGWAVKPAEAVSAENSDLYNLKITFKKGLVSEKGDTLLTANGTAAAIDKYVAVDITSAGSLTKTDVVPWLVHDVAQTANGNLAIEGLGGKLNVAWKLLPSGTVGTNGGYLISVYSDAGATRVWSEQVSIGDVNSMTNIIRYGKDGKQKSASLFAEEDTVAYSVVIKNQLGAAVGLSKPEYTVIVTPYQATSTGEITSLGGDASVLINTAFTFLTLDATLGDDPKSSRDRKTAAILDGFNWGGATVTGTWAEITAGTAAGGFRIPGGSLRELTNKLNSGIGISASGSNDKAIVTFGIAFSSDVAPLTSSVSVSSTIASTEGSLLQEVLFISAEPSKTPGQENILNITLWERYVSSTGVTGGAGKEVSKTSLSAADQISFKLTGVKSANGISFSDIYEDGPAQNKTELNDISVNIIW